MFITELINSFKPSNFSTIINRSFLNSTLFFSKFLILAVILMGLIYVPTLIALPAYFSNQMQKFNTLSINGNYDVVAPVYFPERDSFIVVDTTGIHDVIKGERFLITKEGLKYKFLGKEYFLKGSDFSDVLSNKGGFSTLLSVIAVFILPALFFWVYFFTWLKYFVIIILLSSIFFTLFDLTHFKKRWIKFFNITIVAAIIPILLETISAPISTSYLIEIVKLAGVDIYLVPLIIHSCIIIISTFILHYAGGQVGSDS